MDEADWLTSTDPQAMLTFLRDSGRLTERKARLFACACCRRIWHLLTDERCRTAVEVAERFADSRADASELSTAQVAAEQVPSEVNSRWGAAWGAACIDASDAACESLREAAGWGGTSKVEQAEEAPLLRDHFGPLPFREVRIGPSWLTWGGGTVKRLAEDAYEERLLPSGHLDPARLAVLCDALEDTGCADAVLLGHLRGPGPHVRGCFALDLLLGKE